MTSKRTRNRDAKRRQRLALIPKDPFGKEYDRYLVHAVQEQFLKSLRSPYDDSLPPSMQVGKGPADGR